MPFILGCISMEWPLLLFVSYGGDHCQADSLVQQILAAPLGPKIVCRCHLHLKKFLHQLSSTLQLAIRNPLRFLKQPVNATLSDMGSCISKGCKIKIGFGNQIFYFQEDRFTFSDSSSCCRETRTIYVKSVDCGRRPKRVPK